MRIAQGTYYPDDDDGYPTATHTPDDTGASFVLNDEIWIQGGWEGTGSPGNWDPANYITILSGDIDQNDDDNDPDGLHQVARSSNSRTVVRCNYDTPATNATVLEGCVIRDGQNTNSWQGAGIWIPSGSYPIIRNCVVTRNRIVGNGIGTDGAGIFVENFDTSFTNVPLIEDTIIELNEAENRLLASLREATSN